MMTTVFAIVMTWTVGAFAADADNAALEPSAWKSLMELKSGNQRWVTGKVRHPHQGRKTRAALASGQKPSAIVLSCSDSRVPPELVFDQGLGQLFVVRVAGEVPDASSIASIEYALEHLGARLLVVLGHESCGAVKAALSTASGKSAGSADLDQLLAGIKPHLEPTLDSPEASKPGGGPSRGIASIATAAPDTRLREPVKQNVVGVVQDLMKRSHIVREMVERNQLVIAQGIYALDSGKVDFWEAGHPRRPAATGEASEPETVQRGEAPQSAASDEHVERAHPVAGSARAH